MFLKILGNGEPSRLFVAGIHGNEENVAGYILKLFARDVKINRGRLVLCSLSGGNPYISTLVKAYYDTETGRKLLDLIREYRPQIYLEMHSYGLENYSRLTDPDRKKRIGVPPFIELEEKILIGSISPLIRMSEFNIEDFCFTLEVPYLHSEQALSVALNVMRIIAISSSRDEIIRKLRRKYAEEIAEAEKNFHEFLRDIEDKKLSFF
jgi:hypothetical protein